MAWMVLGGIILIPTATFQGPAHPLSTVTRQIKGAYTGIQQLDEAVDLPPSSFIQYHSLEAHKLWKEIESEEKKNEVNKHGCSLEFDESEFSTRTKTYRNIARSFLTASKSLNLKVMILGLDAIFWVSTILIAIAS
jgi:hypothetical protein